MKLNNIHALGGVPNPISIVAAIEAMYDDIRLQGKMTDDPAPLITLLKISQKSSKLNMKLRVVLINPEIPQNTGNIGRLVSAIGAELLLVGKLGFSLDEKSVRRSGMDYWKSISVSHIENVDRFYESVGDNTFFISTKGERLYTEIPMPAIDCPYSEMDIVFGSEGLGFPQEVYANYSNKLYRIPMLEDKRSLNLANSVSVVVYDILRRLSFENLI